MQRLSTENRELKAATSIQKRGKYAFSIPSRIRAKIRKYALFYGTQAARKHFSSKYPQYEFKQSTVNNWKKKITKDPESREGKFTKVRRPNKVNNKVMLKIKEVINGIRLVGAVFSRKMVISFAAGILKANNPNSLLEFG